VLAVACGVGVSTIYFPQALIPLVASGLRVSTAAAALIATAAQVGYAAGIFLLVPLGDRVRNRPLIVTLLVLTGLCLLVAGAAPSLPVLIVAGGLAGFTTVVPQIIIPMAAGLVDPARRGAVTGTLLSGLIAGILLARTFSGSLGEWLGWRAPYIAAAGFVLLLAVVLLRVVPRTTPSSTQTYPALLGTAVRLFATQPALRRSCLYQALVFGGFSAAWTSISLLIDSSTYRMGAEVVGLIALVGAGSVFATPVAGRAADRRGSDAVNLVCLVTTLAAAAVLTLGGVGGVAGMAALLIGMLLLDVAMQSGQVANQARIFGIDPGLRARLNTAYMTCAFAGGSVGSWLGVRAYLAFGWAGVCGLVALAAGIALVRHVAHLAAVRSGPVTAPEDAPVASGAGAVRAAIDS